MKDEKKRSEFSRRKFVKTTSVAAVGAPIIIKSSVIRANGFATPNDKINIGLIGCGGLGKSNLDACAVTSRCGGCSSL